MSTVETTTTITAKRDGYLYSYNDDYATGRDATDATGEIRETITVGQRLKYVYRAFMSFEIPNMANLSAASLFLEGNSDESTADFEIYIHTSTYNGDPSISDFTLFDGRQSGSAHTGTVLNSTWSSSSYSAEWNEIVFNSSGIASILAAKGTTWEIVIISKEDYDNSAPAGNEVVAFDSSVTADKEPYLELTYTYEVDGTTTYTAAEMVDQLGLYLNKLNYRFDDSHTLVDKAPDEFTKTERLLMLNRAQRKVVSLTVIDYFARLLVLDEDEVVTSGACALTNLSQTPIYNPWGIIGVRTNLGKFCEYIKFFEYKQLINDDKTFDIDKPKWYIYGSSIYVLPTTGISTIDIYYVREPVAMSLATPTACELSDEMQDIILDYATFIGYAQRKDIDRGRTYLELALGGINAINTRIDPEHSVITLTSREAYLDYNRVAMVDRDKNKESR